MSVILTASEQETHNKFLKALRSGNYKQHFGYFFDWDDDQKNLYERKAVAYCAAGVLIACTGSVTEFNHHGYTQEQNNYLFKIPAIDSPYETGKIALYNLNDTKHLSFEEIADVLEKAMQPEF